MDLKQYILKILLLTACCGSLYAQNVVPDNIERAALLAIYNSTDGAHWSPAYRWTESRINSYPDPDSVLYGVTVENGDITAISLTNVGISGTVPQELSTLTELEYLSWRVHINLTGELPDLSALQKLRNLDFYFSNLSGNIPDWIGDIPTLQNLNLTSYPGGASLNGPVPEEISQLTGLSNLSLSYNNLSQAGSIPAALSQLDNLASLDLESTSLNPSSVTTGLSGLNRLSYLNLSGNPFAVMPDSTLPDVLLDLPNLSQLMLQSVPFRYLPGSFTELPKLNYLGLSSNNYSDIDVLSDIVDTLRNCASLRTLVLNGCQLPGLPDDFHTLSAVENLYLSSNPLQESQWEDIGGMPALKALYIQSCNLAALPESLADLNTLETLYAGFNHLYPIPQVIEEIPHLKHLYLNSNGIGALPEWFGGGTMNQLLTLMLDNNQITLPLPAQFGSMTSLTYLSIFANKLAGQLPAFFSGLTNINHLNLGFNEITAPLPDLSTLTSLSNVHLSHNKLSGAVPAFLSNTVVPKANVDLSFNTFDELTPFNPSLGLSLNVSNNRLTFSNILKAQRPIGNYVYIPQDTVDLQPGETFAEAYIGGTLELIATTDRDTDPPSQYQWFRYVDGVNDVPVAGPGGYTYTNPNFQQPGKYYYKVTNPAAPGLSLVSGMINVTVKPCITDAAAEFFHKKYVCAMTFEPGLDSRDCKAIAFHWDFGDGATSQDRRPVHGFDEAGTYTISLTLTYRCGTLCQLDTTVNQQITFDPADAAFTNLEITVNTDRRTEVLSTSASTFSDAWPLSHEASGLDTLNNYWKGVQGVWRNEGAYVYNVPRSRSSATDISKDGTFTLEHFNWQQAELGAIPNWVKANTITQYSPFSYELENRDVLGVYSAALYDYGGHLTSANGVNMRFREMAYTGFEFLDNQASGNWIFGAPTAPDYKVYDVYSGHGNSAVVKANMGQLDNADVVDVSARRLSILSLLRQTNYMADDELICKQLYPASPEWTVMVLRDAPFTGPWVGQIIVKNQAQPMDSPVISDTVAHTGKSSLRIAAPQTFRQELVHLDSGKSYVISAWVSVNNPHVTIPKLADDLGIDVIFKNRDGETVSTVSAIPSGAVIEGWQQLKTTFICPVADAVIELRFRPGSTGTAWYDDLRLHPEKGNMKSYVYDLKDYRLRAILDEENFASLFYYDAEGNLHITKKETARGIKTITENLSYQRKVTAAGTLVGDEH